MAQYISLDVPYYKPYRNNLVELSKHNSHIWQADKMYPYNPYMPQHIAGGSLHNKKIPKELIEKIDQLVVEYGIPTGDEIQGSGLFNMSALKNTLKRLIFDNEYVMVALKIGAVGAVSALLVTIGAPAAVVAITPLLISWTEIAIKQYLKEKKELEKQKTQSHDDISAEYYGSGYDGGAYILPELKGLTKTKIKQLQSQVPNECYSDVKSLLEDYGIKTQEIVGNGYFDNIKNKIESVVKNSKFWKIVGAYGLLMTTVAMIVLLGLVFISTPFDALIFGVALIVSTAYNLYKKVGNGYFEDISKNPNVKYGLKRLDNYSEMIQEDVKHIKQLHNKKGGSVHLKKTSLLSLRHKPSRKIEFGLNSVSTRPIPQKRPFIESNNPGVGIYKGGSVGLNARERRSAKVKEIMKSENLSLVEASKFIKSNNIQY